MRITPWHVLFFATSYGFVSVLTRYALDAGGDPFTILVVRGAGSALLLLATLLATRSSWRLPRRERYWALGLGLLLAVGNYTITESLLLIPVPIAILILYLFPFFTAIASAFLGRERMTMRMVVALVVAFIGLGITVQARVDEYPVAGLLYAGTSAVMFTIVLITQAYVFAGGGDPRPRTMHMLTTVGVVMLVAIVVTDSFRLPRTTDGLFAMAAVPVTYVIGLTGTLAAAIAIGPTRTALIMNFEPVAAILFSAVLLGQVLTPVQLAGVALVIGALVGARRPAPVPPRK